jgi:hypothetical protein
MAGVNQPCAVHQAIGASEFMLTLLNLKKAILTVRIR